MRSLLDFRGDRLVRRTKHLEKLPALTLVRDHVARQHVKLGNMHGGVFGQLAEEGASVSHVAAFLEEDPTKVHVNLDRTISNIHTPAEAGQIKGIVQCLPKVAGANGEQRIQRAAIVSFFAHADELGLVQAAPDKDWLDLGDATVVIDELLAALDDGSSSYEVTAFLEGIGAASGSPANVNPTASDLVTSAANDADAAGDEFDTAAAAVERAAASSATFAPDDYLTLGSPLSAADAQCLPP